jgi:predicted glycosyltransferase
VGGGNVGAELLENSIDAFHLINGDREDFHLQLFCGPYCNEEVFQRLQSKKTSSIAVDRFTNNFTQWLNTADLSISMGGYNTTMNLARTGVPALVYPFAQNREQLLRAQCFSKLLPLSILEPGDLLPAKFAEKIRTQLECPKTDATIALNGAIETARIIREFSGNQ